MRAACAWGSMCSRGTTGHAGQVSMHIASPGNSWKEPSCPNSRETKPNWDHFQLSQTAKNCPEAKRSVLIIGMLKIHTLTFVTVCKCTVLMAATPVSSGRNEVPHLASSSSLESSTTSAGSTQGQSGAPIPSAADLWQALRLGFARLQLED